MVSSCFLISKSSSPFTKPLRIVPSASTTIIITVIFMLLRLFFSSLLFSLCDRPGRQSLLFGKFCLSDNYYSCYYNYSLRVFHISVSWSLSDRKSPQVSRTLLSILTDLNNTVVWMLSTRPLISASSSPFINPLVTVTKAPITIDINVTFMFHIFFQFPSKIEEIIFLFTFFQFYSVVTQDSKVHNFASSLFFCLSS